MERISAFLLHFAEGRIGSLPIDQRNGVTRLGVRSVRIDTQTNGITTLQQARRAQDKNIQNIFSEVLLNSGRSGFASAEIGTNTEPLNERIQQSWDSWYQTELVGRYASDEAPKDLGTNFGAILIKAYQSGGYVDPKAFLRDLSESELTTIQNTHWLAEPIQIDSLTEEGSLNLLLPPAAQIDLNRDGLTQSGAAFGIRFPDSTTPPTVVSAWEQATDGMPLSERMVYELQMKFPVLLANLVTDADGKFLYAREPGQPDFVNPMDNPDYSFVDVTQDWIDHLDYFKNQMDPLRYKQGMEFWKTFQQALRNHAAP